jgi:hypothetical protein
VITGGDLCLSQRFIKASGDEVERSLTFISTGPRAW